MIIPFPQAFAGADGFVKEAAEPSASPSAERVMQELREGLEAMREMLRVG